jgi:tripartite-type tricarboxylate transporter receptor subunit TctC
MFTKLNRRALLAALALAAPLLGTSAVAQQAWPTRPVRLILPFGPASGADIGARLLAEKLQPLWGQPVVVEGKPGGDGLLSINAVLNAKDDHTFFFGPTSAYVVHPYVHDNLSYDPEKDLTPIAGVAQVQIAIAVPTKLGLNTLKDFIDYAKKNQDKVSYGVAPGFSEFVFDGFKREQGLNIPKVPYRDITTSPSDIGEGRLQLGMMSYAAMRATEELGTIKVLAMNSVKRSEIAPNTPSVVEAGFPSLVASPVLGMLGPRDMPMALRQKIARDIMEVMKDPQIRERLNLSGQPAAPMNVEEFTKAVNEQHAQVARIAKLLDIPRKK